MEKAGIVRLKEDGHPRDIQEDSPRLHQWKLIIVTHKRPLLLKKCLGSIPPKALHQMDMMAVINGPDDQAEGLLKASKIPYMKIEETVPAEARNKAVQASGRHYDYFGFADDDVLFPPRYFEHLAEILQTKEWSVVGGGDLTRPEAPSSEWAVGLSLLSPLAVGRTRDRHGLTQQDGPVRPCSERSLILCSMWIRGEVFYSGKRFNHQYRRNEENVLLHELSLMGHPIGFSPRLSVFHKRKDKMKDLFLAVSSSGHHRLKSLFEYPESASLDYVVPLFFLCYLFSLFFFHHPLWMIPLFAYVVLNLSLSLYLCLKYKRPSLIPQVSLLQAVINIAYGWGGAEFLLSRKLK